MSGECFDAGIALDKTNRLRVLLFACQRDIDAQRNVVMKEQALKQLKALRQAVDDAQRVLEGL